MSSIPRFGIYLFVAFLSVSKGLADTTRYEAEDAVLSGTSVSSSVAGFSGTGYVVGFVDGDERVTFSVPGVSGVHRLKVGFRAPYGQKQFNGTINDAGFSGVVEEVSTFSEISIGAIRLLDGDNTISIGGGWNYYEIDYIEIEDGPPPPPLPVVPNPVDPNLSSEGVALLQYLSNNYGKVTISGQQNIEELAIVEDLTGVVPAILGGDFMDYSPSRREHGSNPGTHTEDLIAKHRDDGTIITISWHWNAPTDLLLTEENPWWSGFYSRATTFDFAAALDDPEGDDYGLLLRDIDVIATELKKLQAANVPVLWRPLHESDGGWFWWGTQGADNLIRLWELLYDRLTNHHQIHNLIWVQTIGRLDWYAGDEYVDIVGVDAYPDDPYDPLSSMWTLFKDEFDGRKIIALSEFGPVPDIVTMHEFGTYWSYFMSWSSENGARGVPDLDRLISIYNSLNVLTLDELDQGVDQDEDGLTAAQEAGFGSSDSDKDSNDDGIEDGMSVKIGYEPMDDLSGVWAFYVAEKKLIAVYDGDSKLTSLIALDLAVALEQIEELAIELYYSEDLVAWESRTLALADFVVSSDYVGAVRMVSEGDKAYFRLGALSR